MNSIILPGCLQLFFNLFCNVLKLSSPNGTHLAYIATDEKNMSFFKPFYARFPAVRFLKDFMVLQ
jgi:hypothetical protein